MNVHLLCIPQSNLQYSHFLPLDQNTISNSCLFVLSTVNMKICFNCYFLQVPDLFFYFIYSFISLNDLATTVHEYTAFLGCHHYTDDPNINEPSGIPCAVWFMVQCITSISAFISLNSPHAENCLSTFYSCPCTQEQLERSYQVFLYICIIVNIPHSVALKFKFLTTNSEQRGALYSTDKCRQRENGYHLHRSEVTSRKAARHCWSTKYSYEPKSHPPISVARHVHAAGICAYRLF